MIRDLSSARSFYTIHQREWIYKIIHYGNKSGIRGGKLAQISKFEIYLGASHCRVIFASPLVVFKKFSPTGTKSNGPIFEAKALDP